MKDAFTLARYRVLLEEFQKRGYRACRFVEADPTRRHLILRHDIDMSIRAALPMAEIEQELGLVATYFVLVRTEMYNPFSQQSLDDLQKLIQCDHEIGLHFDASLYDQDVKALNWAAKRECAVLEEMLACSVEVISLHRPAKNLLGFASLLGGRHHALEPRFFCDMGYCTDSRGDWHHGHPLDHPAVAEGRGLQLLTHPIWWNAPANATAQEKLDHLARKQYNLFRAELARNCDVYSLDTSDVGEPHWGP